MMASTSAKFVIRVRVTATVRAPFNHSEAIPTGFRLPLSIQPADFAGGFEAAGGVVPLPHGKKKPYEASTDTMVPS